MLDESRLVTCARTRYWHKSAAGDSIAVDMMTSAILAADILNLDG